MLPTSSLITHIQWNRHYCCSFTVNTLLHHLRHCILKVEGWVPFPPIWYCISTIATWKCSKNEWLKDQHICPMQSVSFVQVCYWPFASGILRWCVCCTCVCVHVCVCVHMCVFVCMCVCVVRIAKWLEHWPVNWKVAGLMLGHATLLFPWTRNFTHIALVYPAVKWGPGLS